MPRSATRTAALCHPERQRGIWEGRRHPDAAPLPSSLAQPRDDTFSRYNTRHTKHEGVSVNARTASIVSLVFTLSLAVEAQQLESRRTRDLDLVYYDKAHEYLSYHL